MPKKHRVHTDYSQASCYNLCLGRAAQQMMGPLSRKGPGTQPPQEPPFVSRDINGLLGKPGIATAGKA